MDGYITIKILNEAYLDGYAVMYDDAYSCFRGKRQVVLGDGYPGGSILDSVMPNTSPYNVRANRATLQSPINNTMLGIVNLSSRSSGTSLGAIGNYVTISGGDQNQSMTTPVVYSTIGGGSGHRVCSSYSAVGGGQNSIIGVFGNIGSVGAYTTIMGGSNGNNFGSNGQYSTALGGSANNANGDYSTHFGASGNRSAGLYSFCGAGGSSGNYAVSCAYNAGSTNTYSSSCSGSASGIGATVCAVNCSATANYSTIINCRTSGIASGIYSLIGMGGTGGSTSGGQYSSIIGSGYTSTASGNYSLIAGGYFNSAINDTSSCYGYKTLTNKVGQYTHSSSNFTASVSSPNGGSQFSQTVYNCISINGASANFTDYLAGEYTLTSSTVYVIKIIVNACTVGGGNNALFINDLLVAVTNTPTASIILNNATLTSNIPGYSGLTISNPSATILRISFAGISGLTVRAVATIEATEVKF